MVDVNVDIFAIVMYCDESILGLNIGNGYTLDKVYLDDLPVKDKITDAKGNLNTEYMGSRLENNRGEFFICLKKHDIFQIDGPTIVPNVVIPMSGPMCCDQLEPYQDKETSYLYEIFSLLHLFQKGNIGLYDVFFDFSYKTLGLMNNNVLNKNQNRSRNIIDQRKYILTADDAIVCNKFLVNYVGRPFNLLKPSIDEFIWGLEQIDVPTGFEQYTTALEMILLERNATGKKQKLANRLAVLAGTSPTEITKIYSDMITFYRFRSESLHEGDGTNISQAELYSLEEYVRCVLKKCLMRCQKELVSNANITWPEIKQTLIDELKVQVTAAKSAGTLPV